MSQTFTVGISDLKVAKNDDRLITYALGSCVGICLYDRAAKVAGLSHIMLPTSQGFSATGTLAHKFADTAIPILVKEMVRNGANAMRLQAKIAGGAQMFACSNNSSLSAIGERNVQSVKAELAKLRIPIVAEDTGANYGRTQLFSATDGVMTIKSVSRGEKSY